MSYVVYNIYNSFQMIHKKYVRHKSKILTFLIQRINSFKEFYNSLVIFSQFIFFILLKNQMGGWQSAFNMRREETGKQNSTDIRSKQNSEKQPLASSNIQSQDKKQQILRIVVGEIGPGHLTKEECIKMMHTIENRMEHKDIQSNIYSQKQYTSLQTPKKQFKLTKAQQQILDQAWRQKNKTPNAGKLGWDLSRNAVKSNENYIWKSQQNKTGVHYYYDAVKVEENKEDTE